MPEYILELNGITKDFPGVRALDNVHFKLKRGEIHALVGENGAGKSTFIKVITGVHSPEFGEMYLNGTKEVFTNPREAQNMGIAAIYQNVTNYPDLSVTENIFMSHQKVHSKTKKLLWNKMHKEAKDILQQLGSTIDPKMEMQALSVAQQQIVEIAKAISTNAKIIIMDEPTAALTARESEELYKITEKLRDDGTSIIFISHRFEDIFRLASQITVLRDAKYIGSWNVNEISHDQLIVAMVGREITQVFPTKKAIIGEKLFEVKNLSKLGYFADISFTLHRGEILGLTGLIGAGRTEVCQALFGITSYDQGETLLNNKSVKIKRPKEAMDLGIGYLPEDRQLQGLIFDWDIEKNISLPALTKLSIKGWLSKKNEATVAKTLAEKVDVKANSIFDLVSSLSGGNQQKVAVAKLLTADLDIIILDEPTKGVDIGAKSAIYEIINKLAEQGFGIIMISSEMPEILGMSDRIIVMRDGRIANIFTKEDATQERILEAALSESSPPKEAVIVM